MYKCDCGTTYDLTREHYGLIAVECNKLGIATTIVICPGCSKARIVGAESDWDETEGKSCLNMYGHSVEEYGRGDLWKEGLLAFMGKKEE